LIFIVLTSWKNSLWVDMSPHSDTLSGFRANQSLFLLLNTSCLSVKQQIPNVIVTGLTRSGLEHTTYHTRVEQTNHYNTDFKIASSNSVRFCEHPNPVRLAISPFLINKPFCLQSRLHSHIIFLIQTFKIKKRKSSVISGPQHLLLFVI